MGTSSFASTVAASALSSSNSLPHGPSTCSMRRFRPVVRSISRASMLTRSARRRNVPNSSHWTWAIRPTRGADSGSTIPAAPSSSSRTICCTRRRSTTVKRSEADRSVITMSASPLPSQSCPSPASRLTKSSTAIVLGALCPPGSAQAGRPPRTRTATVMTMMRVPRVTANLLGPLRAGGPRTGQAPSWLAARGGACRIA